MKLARVLSLGLVIFSLAIIGCEEKELSVYTHSLTKNLDANGAQKVSLHELSGSYVLNNSDKLVEIGMGKKLNIFGFQIDTDFGNDDAESDAVVQVKNLVLLRGLNWRLIMEFKVKLGKFTPARYMAAEVKFIKDGLLIEPLNFNVQTLASTGVNMRRYQTKGWTGPTKHVIEASSRYPIDVASMIKSLEPEENASKPVPRLKLTAIGDKLKSRLHDLRYELSMAEVDGKSKTDCAFELLGEETRKLEQLSGVHEKAL